MRKCNRPALRWFGGKWSLAPWIISHFPKHQIYVEPYGGAASVLLRKARIEAEVYNDLDASVVGLFCILRDPARAKKLSRAIALTPFASREFELAHHLTDDDDESARRLIVRSFMSFGSGGNYEVKGFRASSLKSGRSPGARSWITMPDGIDRITERLRGVVIECLDALQVMANHDTPETLHYVDPPYVHSTRTATNSYAVEMTDDDHAEMLEFLKGLSGMVVLSGYPCALYDDALDDWTVFSMQTYDQRKKKRMERLWINPRCAEMQDQPSLFASDA